MHFRNLFDLPRSRDLKYLASLQTAGDPNFGINLEGQCYCKKVGQKLTVSYNDFLSVDLFVK